MIGSKDELKLKIDGCRKNSAGARRYPPALRAEILQYLDREVQAGGHFTKACGELGVHTVLVRRWRRTQRQAGFAAVTVVDEVEPPVRRPRVKEAAELTPALPVVQPAAFTLTSPRGWRIDGLSLEALAALLPRLS